MVQKESPGEVDLAPLVPVDGVVRDSVDGTALGDARIELLGRGTDRRARSTDDGRFRLGGVAAGRYTVRITRLGYEPLVL
ncbi:MAG TPA: carboxypeptidase-like regulatory domain-containing protein, partial [Gemmatimonadaceae bacterium]